MGGPHSIYSLSFSLFLSLSLALCSRCFLCTCSSHFFFQRSSMAPMEIRERAKTFALEAIDNQVRFLSYFFHPTSLFSVPFVSNLFSNRVFPPLHFSLFIISLASETYNAIL